MQYVFKNCSLVCENDSELPEKIENSKTVLLEFLHIIL